MCPLCPQCREEAKHHHTLFGYKISYVVLPHLTFSHLLPDFSQLPHNILTGNIHTRLKLPLEQSSLFNYILWNIWTNRNLFLFQNKENQANDVFFTIRVLASKYIRTFISINGRHRQATHN